MSWVKVGGGEPTCTGHVNEFPQCIISDFPDTLNQW